MDGDSDIFAEAATRGVLWKKVFLEISQNSQENTCVRASFLIKLQAQACNFIKKETLTQVFPYEFCEISKSTFFTEHLRATASGFVWLQPPNASKITLLKVIEDQKALLWNLFLCFRFSLSLFLCLFLILCVSKKLFWKTRSSHRRCSIKNVALKI